MSLGVEIGNLGLVGTAHVVGPKTLCDVERMCAQNIVCIQKRPFEKKKKKKKNSGNAVDVLVNMAK